MLHWNHRHSSLSLCWAGRKRFIVFPMFVLFMSKNIFLYLCQENSFNSKMSSPKYYSLQSMCLEFNQLLWLDKLQVATLLLWWNFGLGVTGDLSGGGGWSDGSCCCPSVCLFAVCLTASFHWQVSWTVWPPAGLAHTPRLAPHKHSCRGQCTVIGSACASGSPTSSPSREQAEGRGAAVAGIGPWSEPRCCGFWSCKD